MNTLQSIWYGLDWSYLLNIVLSVVPALLCITFHEVSHGWVAYRLGDPTAKNAGRLTLNPLKHIDMMGLLMMVVFKFGWAKPVPVNMMRFRNPKRGMALTALAGPASNVLLALVFLFLYGLLYRALYSVQFLSLEPHFRGGLRSRMAAELRKQGLRRCDRTGAGYRVRLPEPHENGRSLLRRGDRHF